MVGKYLRKGGKVVWHDHVNNVFRNIFSSCNEMNKLLTEIRARDEQLKEITDKYNRLKQGIICIKKNH